jgi:hypothetical protein
MINKLRSIATSEISQQFIGLLMFLSDPCVNNSLATITPIVLRYFMS